MLLLDIKKNKKGWFIFEPAFIFENNI